MINLANTNPVGNVDSGITNLINTNIDKKIEMPVDIIFGIKINPSEIKISSSELEEALKKAKYMTGESDLPQEEVEAFAKGEIELNQMIDDMRRKHVADFNIMGEQTMAKEAEKIREQYEKDHPEYASAKEKITPELEKHDEYMAERLKQWEEENQINPYINDLTQFDRHAKARAEFMEGIEKDYYEQNPNYRHIKDTMDIEKAKAQEKKKEESSGFVSRIIEGIKGGISMLFQPVDPKSLYF